MNTGEDPQFGNSLPSACGRLHIHINSRSAVFKGLHHIANATRAAADSRLGSRGQRNRPNLLINFRKVKGLDVHLENVFTATR
jgi:hypothetical protein